MKQKKAEGRNIRRPLVIWSKPDTLLPFWKWMLCKSSSKKEWKKSKKPIEFAGFGTRIEW